MLIVTKDTISGKDLEELGFVQGNIVMTKPVGKLLVAGFKAMKGGEIPLFTELINEGREIAKERLKEQAMELGADAIVCVRMNSCSLMDGATEVTLYGTAVKFK
jgi:uncharacterized protein YbjQ (UPF0145 family)